MRTHTEDSGVSPSTLPINVIPSRERKASLPWFNSVGSVMGSSGRGVLITDSEGTICYANDRMSEITGYSPGELRGNNPKMLQSGYTSRSTYATMWNTISSGRSWKNILQNRRKNRETYIEEITITPIVDRRGAISHFFGEICEIDVGHPAPTLRRPNKDLERAAEISQGISHEINNVLMGIIGNCSLAKHRCELGEAAFRRVDTIQSLAERLAAFSKKLSVCAGQGVVRPEKIDLNALIVDALDSLEPVLDLGPVMTTLTDYPLVVNGDSGLLGLAVKELVRNSLEANRSSDRDIFVALSLGEWDGECRSEGVISLDFGLPRGVAAVISVIDEGVGMDLPLLEFAPELFFSTKLTHAGLGLPAVIGVARSHSGAFELRTSPGKGTVARLYLPLAPSFGTKRQMRSGKIQ